eukprot:TRINITY_DN6172_c0_g1_i1.p1 TRINITY_DN6172_c0_g1~~TRINITY_DN6172_c0_g1_i1.p1  ORF type:complete len:270 (+),score=11.08 TRINITY_DN6172_c0_g1_i1:243-1052(+)
MSGLNIVVTSLVNVTVSETQFNLDAEGPTMLEIERGSITVEPGNIVRCTNTCNKPIIKVSICYNSGLDGVMLEKSGKGDVPIFEFSPCKEEISIVPALVIQRIKFNGNVPTKDSTWIQVLGDETSGPKVEIYYNDYGGLANIAHAQIGTVFRFMVPLKTSDVKSNFTLLRTSDRSSPVGWGNEDPLATVMCSDGTHSSKILPIGPTKEQQYSMSCPRSLYDCCYVENEFGNESFSESIANCAKGQEETIYVIRDCPLGKNGSKIHANSR